MIGSSSLWACMLVAAYAIDTDAELDAEYELTCPEIEDSGIAMGFHVKSGTVTGKLTVEQTYDCCGKDDCDLECTDPCPPTEPPVEPPIDPPNPPADFCIIDDEPCNLALIYEIADGSYPALRNSDGKCWYMDRTGNGKSDNPTPTWCRDVYSETIVATYAEYTAPIGFSTDGGNDDLFYYICIVEVGNGDFIPGHTTLDSNVCKYAWGVSDKKGICDLTDLPGDNGDNTPCEGFKKIDVIDLY